MLGNLKVYYADRPRVEGTIRFIPVIVGSRGRVGRFVTREIEKQRYLEARGYVAEGEGQPSPSAAPLPTETTYETTAEPTFDSHSTMHASILSDDDLPPSFATLPIKKDEPKLSRYEQRMREKHGKATSP